MFVRGRVLEDEGYQGQIPGGLSVHKGGVLEEGEVLRGRVLEDVYGYKGRALECEWLSGAACWRMKGSQGQSAGV